MKRFLFLGALLLAGSLGLHDATVGHGGTYRGPGDTVPPGSGSGGGGGGSPTPGPGGPSQPGSGGAGTPGAATPGAPGGPGTGTRGPASGGAGAGPDLSAWQFWWGFNKDPYLQLKARIHDGRALTGSDDFYLGYGQQDQGRDSLKPSEETIRDKVVPALVRALETESNTDIITGAMVALAKIGDARSEEGTSQFQQLIQRRLGDPVQEIRETAAVSLGILANPASIPLLEAIALGDEAGIREAGVDPSDVGSYRTRAFATYGLGLVGHRASAADRERIVAVLRRLLDTREGYATRDIPVAAIISMGLVPIERLAAEPPADPGERDEWLRARRRDPAPEVSRWQQVQYLIGYLDDGRRDHLNRAHAPRAIAMLLEGADPELRARSVESLLEFAGRRASGVVELRQSAVLALGQIGTLGDSETDTRIRQALRESYGDPHGQVRGFAMIALGRIGGRPGPGEDPEAGYRELREFMLRSLARARGTTKPWVGLALGVMEHARRGAGLPTDHDVIRALRAGLADEAAPAHVGAYAIGAGLAGDVESETLLLDKLARIRVDEARGEIAVGLGLLGSASAIEPIQGIIRASKFRPELLREAAIALGLLGDKDVVLDLATMLAEATSLATQAAIASALGYIGDARSIDPLVAMLGDKGLTARARAFAAVALGIVADKEPLPWNSKIGVNINYRANTTTLTDPGGSGILDIL